MGDDQACIGRRSAIEAMAANPTAPIDKAELLQHLSICSLCAEAFAAMLVNRLELGDEEMVCPHELTAPDVYDRYLAARRGSKDSKDIL